MPNPNEHSSWNSRSATAKEREVLTEAMLDAGILEEDATWAVSCIIACAGLQNPKKNVEALVKAAKTALGTASPYSHKLLREALGPFVEEGGPFEERRKQ